MPRSAQYALASFMNASIMTGRIGRQSYSVKDLYPVASRIYIQHPIRMPDQAPLRDRDPFISGLRVILEHRADLTEAGVSAKAGLDNSTVRKLLSGENASPKVSTAQRIADALGYSLSTIIALGLHPRAKEVLAIIDRAEKLSAADQKELASYLDYLIERSRRRESQPESDPEGPLSKTAG